MAPDDGHAAGAWRRPDALLEHYEAIADESRAMLAAARAGDWAGVTRSEQRCGDRAQAAVAQVQLLQHLHSEH